MSIRSITNLTLLEVHRPTVTKDAYGARIETFAKVHSYKARVQPLSASESIRNSRESAQVDHKVYIAGKADVLPGDRLIFSKDSTRTLEVTGVRNIDEWDRFTTIEAMEIDT